MVQTVLSHNRVDQSNRLHAGAVDWVKVQDTTMATSAPWSDNRESIDLSVLLGAQVDLFNSTDSCEGVLALFENPTPRWLTSPKLAARAQRFTHIPQAGGSVVESHFGWGFVGHSTYRDVQSHLPRRGSPYFTLLRHPVERALSAYFNVQSGRHQAEKVCRARQALFCRPGTGRFEKTTCVPRLSPYEWMRCHSAPKQASDPFCSVIFDQSSDGPQYQFNFLKPTANATLPSVVRMLGERFFLVGVTEQMPTLLQLASRALNMASKGTPAAEQPSSPHPAAADLLTEAQYRELMEDRLFDLALYKWAQARLERLAGCLNMSVERYSLK